MVIFFTLFITYQKEIIMAKKKKAKWPYKFVRKDQVDELHRESTQDLLVKSHKQQKETAALIKQKKENHAIQDLKDQIKDHTSMHENNEEISKLAAQIKDLRDEVKEEIADIIEDKKALDGGFNDSIKASKEMQKVITKILSGRDL